MPGPVFDPTTERVYDSLPQHFIDADENYNWTLKRYISGICGEQDKVNDLIERLDFTPVEDGGDPNDTSDLVDWATADEAWLPWLAQLLGINPAKLSSDPRTDISQASTGLYAGTKQAIANAVKPVLVGDRYVQVYPRSTNTGRNTGGQWDVLIVTRATETLINLVPEYIATSIDPTNFTYPASFVVEVASNNQFYKGRTLRMRMQTSDAGTITLKDQYRFQAYAGDPFNFLFSLGINSPTPTKQKITAGVKFFNAAGTQIGTYSQVFDVTQVATNFALQTTAPALTTTASFYFTYDNATLISALAIPVSATNLALNPAAKGATSVSAGGGTSLWSGTRTSVTIDPDGGFKATLTDASLTSRYQRLNYIYTATTPGLPYSFVAQAKSDNSIPLTAYVVFYDASNVQVGGGYGYTTVATTATEWTTIKFQNITPTAGSTKVGVYFAYEGTGYRAIGHSFVIKNLTVVQATTVGDPFSGADNDTKKTATRWTGAPHNSTSARYTLAANSEYEFINADDDYDFGMFGARREASLLWNNKTANPIQAVIERGAKPAGVRLWHTYFSTTWDNFTAAYPTWDAVEGKTWVQIEETGL